MKRSLIVICSLALTIVFGGCKRKEAPPAAQAPAAPTPAAPSAAPSAEAAKEADDIFSTRCVPCHGTQGRGDGPASASLSPKPRNYTDPAWQKTVTDEEIEKAIVYGGAAVGKSAAMPPNPDLAGKPEVVAALRAKVRSFGKQ